ncbi:MAG: hypothetical protein AB8B53_14525 [Flavobacteriales bacterium]
MDITKMLTHTHGGLRYLLLLVIGVAIIKFFLGWNKNRVFKPLDKKLALWTLILAHLQLVFGLVLYFLKGYPNTLASGEAEMGNGIFRYFAVEHLVLMLVAIALITVGYSRAKRMKLDFRKFRILLLTYLGSVLIISISLYMKVHYGA